MNAPDQAKLNTYMRLLGLHRGEARAAYDAVAADYDGFANLWDRHIAAPALEFYNLLIRQHVKPGALVLDAGAGTGERTLALLRNSQPGVVVGLDASAGMVFVARSKIDDRRVRFVQGDITGLPFDSSLRPRAPHPVCRRIDNRGIGGEVLSDHGRAGSLCSVDTSPFIVYETIKLSPRD